MAETLFINSAIIKISIGGTSTTVNSNKVVAVLAINPTIVKSQKYDLVVSGTVQTYTIIIGNTNSAPILATTFTDVIPIGMTFVVGSFKINGVAAVPTVAGQTITYIIPTMLGSSSNTITFDVLVA